MTYKEAVTKEMVRLGKDERVRFIGYNTLKGHQMYGTLPPVPLSRRIETPICESLMMGMAMGMSLEGLRPVVCFERMDFILMAADAIINHLDKLPKLSGEQFDFPVIVRIIKGCTTPLQPGIQHCADYTSIIKQNTDLEIRHIGKASDVKSSYFDALSRTRPLIVVEEKKLWDSK